MFEKRTELRKFLAVVSAGKISTAATELGITQPALTRLIAKLESDFGAQLFERVPTGVRLTLMGDHIAEKARHLLREIELAESEVAALTAGRLGSLRISAGPVWMASLLPSVIARFNQSFPDLQIHLQTATFEQALSMLSQGEIDIHCGVFDAHAPMAHFIEQRAMLDVDLGVMAHSSHPLVKKRNPAIIDLTRYPWLSYQSEHSRYINNDWPSLKDLMDEIVDQSGQRAKTVIYSDTIGFPLLKHGHYLTYLPVNLASSIPDLSLRPVRVKLCPTRLPSGLTYRSSLNGTPILASLCDLIADAIKQLSGQ